MKCSTFFWKFSIMMTICSCNSEKVHQNSDPRAIDEQTTLANSNVMPLADSLIPESVRKATLMLKENGLKIYKISRSKWSLFGNEGVWVKTEKGIVDIVPIAKHIDGTKISVLRIHSDTSDFYIYELRYMGGFVQSLQGHQTYFTVGKNLIYKTLMKELNDVIMIVESK